MSSERLAQILRAGRLVGAAAIGTREEIKAEALPVLEDVEEKYREHRRRRALNGAIAPSDGASTPAPPPRTPATDAPAPSGAIIVRRRGEGPP